MPQVLTKSRNRGRGATRAANAAWKALRAGEVRVLQAAAPAKLPWLAHGFSTRAGGASTLDGARVLNLSGVKWDTREHVERNRAEFLGALGAAGMALVTLRQIHSDHIHVLAARPPEKLTGDAAITRAPGLLLAVGTADCVPVLLADTRRRVVAAVHAGWRGTLKRIAAKTLGRMRMEFGTRPAEVVAVLGPGIGRCCYEVGAEVAQAFAAQFAAAREWFEGPFDRLATGEEPNPLPWLSMIPPGHQPPPPRVQLDLPAAIRWQLLEAGLVPRNVVTSRYCTVCRGDLFFSYRREGGHTGRMLAVIGIRA